MKVNKIMCDVCGVDLPEINKWHRGTTRIKAKIKRIKNEFDYRGSKTIKLDLCEQCLYNLCANYSTRLESEEQ